MKKLGSVVDLVEALYPSLYSAVTVLCSHCAVAVAVTMTVWMLQAVKLCRIRLDSACVVKQMSGKE